MAKIGEAEVARTTGASLKGTTIIDAEYCARAFKFAGEAFS
jgi:hypothetical protein